MIEPGSLVKTAKSPLVSGLSFTPSSERINPSGRAFILLMPFAWLIKFFELYEKSASIFDVPVFLNVYSKAPTGKLELSASVGMNGLQPVSRTSTGISSSCISMMANGNLAVNRVL